MAIESTRETWFSGSWKRLRQVCAVRRRKRSTSRPARSQRRRCFEQMEGRDLMSATPMEIGMNLDQVNDDTPNWNFTDVFLHSRNWISHSYNTVTRQADFQGGECIPVQTEGSGWPTQLATWTNAQGHLMQQRLGTLMFRELDGKYPAGTYRAEWRGTGDERFGF